MTKILIGFVTFGNWKYTSMLLDSLNVSLKNAKKVLDIDVEMVGVVGKPNDTITANGLRERGISFFQHFTNMGFPSSLNDIYEYGFIKLESDYVIILGNDILLQEHALENLVKTTLEHKFDFLSGMEISIDKFISLVQGAEKFFDLKNNKKFLGSSLPDWGKVAVSKTEEIRNRSNFSTIGDTQNFAIFSKNCFDKVGYTDVNFYPAYFNDNDYGKRMQLAELKIGDTNQAIYLHFWSRTIYEENMKRTNDKYFPLNKQYYISKWGGEPGKEKKSAKVKIENRVAEVEVVERWRSL